jgi:hypothetical protein
MAGSLILTLMWTRDHIYAEAVPAWDMNASAQIIRTCCKANKPSEVKVRTTKDRNDEWKRTDHLARTEI